MTAFRILLLLALLKIGMNKKNTEHIKDAYLCLLKDIHF